jgi:ubiquinone/menaquinone biosynthesis C-methylase UbiE
MDRLKIWDYWASRYEKLWVQKHSLGPTRRAIIRRMGGILKPGGAYRILDMGCATGQLLREIRESYPLCDLELTGVDISPGMIEEARRKGGSIAFIQSSIDEYRRPDSSFDVIICSHSLPYYRNKPEALQMFSRMMENDGRFFLAHGSINNPYDWVTLKVLETTVSRADFLSLPRSLELQNRFFQLIGQEQIRDTFYMPSIFLFENIKKKN